MTTNLDDAVPVNDAQLLAMRNGEPQHASSAQLERMARWMASEILRLRCLEEAARNVVLSHGRGDAHQSSVGADELDVLRALLRRRSHG